MRQSLLKLGLPLATGLLFLAGCVDDNYDLSDIDTTTELKVTDLTIPIKIKPIVLTNVLDIKEDDPDALITVDRSDPDNPMFVVRKTGDFSADPTTVEKITAASSEIESTTTEATGDIVDYIPRDLSRKHRTVSGPAVKFSVGSSVTTFDYDIKNTDKALFTISHLGLENSKKHRTYIGVRVGSPDIAKVGDRVIFEDVKLQFSENVVVEAPEGCTFKDGILTIPSMEADASNGFTPYIEIGISEFNFATPIRLKKDTQINEPGQCIISEKVGIKSAELYVMPKGGSTPDKLPTNITVRSDYYISDLVVENFSGDVRYEVDVNGIPDITLSDIPSFLAGEETNIALYEPKFTLNVDNYLANYNISAISGITLTAQRNNYVSEPISLNQFEIGSKGVGPWKIEMGPRLQNKSEGFTNSYNFPGLSNLLAGPGLPHSIVVRLTSDKCPKSAVLGNARKFPLGRELHSIEGKYTFFSPFAMCDGSTIYYTYETKDWNEEELDKVKADYVKVSGVATTDIPCSLQLSCSLLDKQGQPLPIKGSNSFVVPAFATSETGAFELRLDPADPAVPFQNIDGVIFTAKATQADNGTPITPNQTITVSDIRFKLTGTYTTDF